MNVFRTDVLNIRFLKEKYEKMRIFLEKRLIFLKKCVILSMRGVKG